MSTILKNFKLCLSFSIILACILLTGCDDSNDDLPDTYQKGSDYQYMEKETLCSYHQQGDGTEYFWHNDYIYYMDRDSNTILPLCSKADCLHDSETSSDKVTACNAYAPAPETANAGGIGYYNGYLYYIYNNDLQYTLNRLSADGTKKEQIHQWDKGISIGSWIVHRGSIYYSEQEHAYVKEKDSIEDIYTLKTFPADGNGIIKPKTIYTAGDEFDAIVIGHLDAFGSFMYFNILATIKTDEKITDDNYIDYTYMKTFIYDINEDKIKELTYKDMPKTAFIQGVTFWQNKILFGPYDAEKDFNEPVTWYIAELDGSNAEVFRDDIENGLNMLSDGRYLYLSNIFLEESGDVKGEKIYKIYDKDFKQVDSVKLPFDTFGGEPAIGDADCMYVIYDEKKADAQADEDESDEWCVILWDKSGIGGYNGSAFEITKIKYGGK